ncbi:MAG: TIM barrel protein [Anaerolineaceae bacterium]|nr:TIM barrel protein [Anaerolineaceae bacterium]
MKIGIQSVCTADLEVEGVISLAKELGLDGVELAAGYLGKFRGEPEGPQWHISTADTLASAETAALLARQAGVEIFAFASRCEVEELEKFESLCRAAGSIGCPLVRIGCGRYDPGLGYWGSMNRSRKLLAAAIEIARKHDVRPVVELHDKTMADGVLASYELVREFSPREVGIIFDAGNARLFGYQPWPQALDILFDYISHVHAKDLAWVREGDKVRLDFTGPGQGFVEWAELLKLLKDRGYEGYLSIEDYRGGWCRKNPDWPAERKAGQWKEFLEGILKTL